MSWEGIIRDKHETGTWFDFSDILFHRSEVGKAGVERATLPVRGMVNSRIYNWLAGTLESP